MTSKENNGLQRQLGAGSLAINAINLTVREACQYEITVACIELLPNQNARRPSDTKPIDTS